MKSEEKARKNTPVTSPNDAFFKEIFSQPEHAVAFFKKHLTTDLVKTIDWKTLALMRDSHVKSDLRQLHSDLLFSVSIAGKKSLLYLLFEHQSTVDPAMPLRLLSYLCQIWITASRDKGFPLPPIIPFVLHQGPEKWTASTSFEDLFDLPEETAEFLLAHLPRFNHALLDLSQIDPSQEKETSDLQMILYLMKQARHPDLLKFLEWMAQTLTDHPPAEFLKRLLTYALTVDSDLDMNSVAHTLQKNPRLKTTTMTLAEKLTKSLADEFRTEGIEKGRKEGRQEGRQEGMKKGEMIGAIRMLEDFLQRSGTSREALEQLPPIELKKRHQQLQEDYEIRFKQ